MDNKEKSQEQAKESAMPTLETTRKPGGLYRHIKMSVKTANILVIVLCAILVFTMVFLASHGGFTVKFDTDGGSHIESCKVMHSETVPMPKDPVKEGYIFKGWYRDRDCSIVWNIDTDTVSESMTLYAGWEEKQLN